MGLTTCRDCGKPMSDEAAACPQCGAPNRPLLDRESRRNNTGCLTLAIIVALALGGMLAVQQCTPRSPAVRRPAPTVAMLPSGDGWRVTVQQGMLSIVSLSPAAAALPSTYPDVAARLCAGKERCQVAFWAGGAPTALPMTDAQAEREIARWKLNSATGLGEWTGDCEAAPASPAC